MRLFCLIFKHCAKSFFDRFCYLKTRKVPKYLSSWSFSSTDAFFPNAVFPPPLFHRIFPLEKISYWLPFYSFKSDVKEKRNLLRIYLNNQDFFGGTFWRPVGLKNINRRLGHEFWHRLGDFQESLAAAIGRRIVPNYFHVRLRRWDDITPKVIRTTCKFL